MLGNHYSVCTYVVILLCDLQFNTLGTAPGLFSFTHNVGTSDQVFCGYVIGEIWWALVQCLPGGQVAQLIPLVGPSGSIESIELIKRKPMLF